MGVKMVLVFVLVSLISVSADSELQRKERYMPYPRPPPQWRVGESYGRAIPYTVSDGLVITVDGTFLPTAKTVVASLEQGQNADSPVPLHMAFRFDEQDVIVNHFNGRTWGMAARFDGFLRKAGEPFQLKIIVRDHAFLIFVNNGLLGEFQHHVKKENARFLELYGDVQTKSIRFYQGLPKSVKDPNGLTLPYTVDIPGGLFPGMVICIGGVPLKGPDFAFGLNTGPLEKDDRALHLDVRFSMPEYNDYNVVVMNSMIGGLGDWGTEQRKSTPFPFKVGKDFTMCVLVEVRGYHIYVDSVHYDFFRHRLLPLSRVTHLYVRSSLVLKYISFQ